ncbi:MAG: hypothetical protein QW393_03520, partial [Candidatus Micrarchaeaceae archaeon]
MFKPNNKKMLTVLIAVAMIFSAFAILSFAAQPASASSSAMSGSFTVLPTEITVSSFTTLISINSPGTASGPASSPIYFWWSTTPYAQATPFYPFAGIVTSTASGTLPAGATFLAENVPTTAGTYYLLATTSFFETPNTARGVAVSNAITVTTTPSPTLELGILPSSLADTFYSALPVVVGETVYFEGSGYTGTSVNVYLSNVVNGPLLATATVSNGVIAGNFTVPAVPQVSANPNDNFYYVVAYDSSSGGTGLTATQNISVTPSVTVSGSIPANSVTFSLTITGTGFLAGQTFSAFTPTSSGTSDVTIDGVNAFISAATVAANGDVSISVSGLQGSSGVPSGPQPINMTYSSTAPVTNSGKFLYGFVVYASSPVAPYVSSILTMKETTSGDTGAVSPATISTGVYLGDSFAIVGWNFPASVRVTVYFDNVPLGPFTTDSNGFFSGTAPVPDVPPGNYYPYAVAKTDSFNVYTPLSTPTGVNSYGFPTGFASPAFMTVISQFKVLDPMGFLISLPVTTPSTPSFVEYIPAGGVVTVEGLNLAPNTEYVVFDTALDDSPIDAGIATVVQGKVAPDGFGIITTSSGNFKLTYPVTYTTATATTGTLAEIGLLIPSQYAAAVAADALPSEVSAFGYYEVGTVTVAPVYPSGMYSFLPGTVVTVDISNLIPFGSTVSLFPGVSNVYGFYFNGVLQTISPSSSVTHFTGSPEGTETVLFKVPAGTANGVYTLEVQNGTVSASGTFTPIAVNGQYVSFIVSTPAALISASGATVEFDPLFGAPTMVGSLYALDFFGFKAGETVTYYIYTNLGPVGTSITMDANGAYQTSLSGTLIPATVAGTYSVTVERAAGASAVTPATYTISAVASFVPDTNSFYPVTAPSSSGGVVYAGGAVSVYAYGLASDTVYVLNMAGSAVDTEVTGPHGSAIFSFTVPPYESPGLYNLTVATLSAPTVAVLTLQLEVKTGVIFVPSGAAFPGELVQFYIPSSFISTYSFPTGASNEISQLTVLVELNGSAFENVTVEPVTMHGSTYYSGSFQMPNAPVGTYWIVGLKPLDKVSYTMTSTQSQTGSLAATVATSNSGAAVGTSTISNGGTASFSLTASDQVATGSISTDTIGASITDLNDLVGSVTLTGPSPPAPASGPYTVSITFSTPGTVPYSSTFVATNVGATGLYPLTVNNQATPYSIDVTSYSGSGASAGITFTIYTTGNPTATYNGISYSDIITSNSVTVSPDAAGTSIGGFYYTLGVITLTTGKGWVPASETLTYAISGTGTVTGEYYDVVVTSYSATPTTSTIPNSAQTYYTGYQITTTFSIVTAPSASFGLNAVDLTGISLAYPATTVPDSISSISGYYYTPTYTGTVTGSVSGSISLTLTKFGSNIITSEIGSADVYSVTLTGTVPAFTASQPLYSITGAELQIYTPTAESGSTPNYLSDVSLSTNYASSISVSDLSGIYTTQSATLTVDVAAPSAIGSLTFSLTSGGTTATSSQFSGDYEVSYTLSASSSTVTTLGSNKGYVYEDSVSYTISTTASPINDYALLSTKAETTSASAASVGTYSNGTGTLLSTDYSTLNPTVTVFFTTPPLGTPTALVQTAQVPFSFQLGSTGLDVVVTSDSIAFSPSASAYSGSLTFSLSGSVTPTPANGETTGVTSSVVTMTATESAIPLSGSYTYNQVITSLIIAETGSLVQEQLVKLAQGKGALITGITSSQLATIVADVGNAVTTSMQVPLSELNASVVAINGAVAKISTAFGNMTASLKAINATVSSILNGQ